MKYMAYVMALCLAAGVGLAAGAAELQYELKVEEAAPPEALAAPIREAMQEKVYRLSEEGKVVFEFWFRDGVAVMWDQGENTLEAVEPVTLLGAVKVHQEVYDYRDDAVAPGVYTMRMSMLPQDGNHMGVAPTRTFALLLEAEEDQAVKLEIDEEEMIDMGMEGRVAPHPPILNLQPPEEGAELPKQTAVDEDTERLDVKLPVSGEDVADDSTISFGVVYRGYGEV